jgi:hypothetical protein
MFVYTQGNLIILLSSLLNMRVPDEGLMKRVYPPTRYTSIFPILTGFFVHINAFQY